MEAHATGIGSDVKDVSSELLITVGGIFTSMLVVGANYLVTRMIDFNFLSMNLWFVIPAGALLGGFGAASGYYFTAIYLQRMPTRKLLLNMMAIGLSTWVLVKWLPYATMTLNDGRHVADVVSFIDYIKFEVEHTTLTFGTRSNVKAFTTGELGSLGYVREVLEIIGFVAGGFCMYGVLVGTEACKKCQRYTKNTKVLDNVQADRFDAVLGKVGLVLPDLVNDAKAILGDRYGFKGLSLSLHQCPSCRERWLRPALVYSDGGKQDRTAKLRQYAVNAEMADAVQLHAKSS